MTPRIPQLAQQLELAAARRARRRSWTRRPLALALVAALLVATSAGAAALIARGHVGGEPTARYGADAPEANSDMPLHYATQPVVLGVAPLSGGRQFEVVGYQLRSRFGPNLCLDIHVLPDGPSYGCGNDHERAQGSSSGPDATLVDGAAEPDVARVEVRYTTATGSGRATAALVHVNGPVIAQVRVSDPFGFYLAELPGGVKSAVAEGYDATGRRRWEAVLLTLPGERVPPPSALLCASLRGRTPVHRTWLATEDRALLPLYARHRDAGRSCAAVLPALCPERRRSASERRSMRRVRCDAQRRHAHYRRDGPRRLLWHSGRAVAANHGRGFPRGHATGRPSAGEPGLSPGERDDRSGTLRRRGSPARR